MLQSLHPAKATVLVIDDDPLIHQIAARALGQFGFKRLHIAETAEDAFEFLERHHCDIALIDYLLPGMTGLELVERLHLAWPDIRAIVVSGYEDPQVAVTAMRSGAVDFVAKDDFLSSRLVRSVQLALRQREAADREERRTRASGSAAISVLRAEANWLAEGIEPSHADQEDEAGLLAYGEEGWAQTYRAFAAYFDRVLAAYPEPAPGEESALVRVLMEREVSPARVMTLYRAYLRAAGPSPTFACSPMTALARLLARLVGEYQTRQTYDALSR